MNVIIDIDMGWFFGLDFGVPGVKSMILCMLDKYYEVELYPLPLDLLFLFIVCVQGHMMCMRGKHSLCVEVRKQLCGVSSVLLPLHGIQASNSGLQTLNLGLQAFPYSLSNLSGP